MAIKNLIFDLDGTLIDSSEGVVEAVNYSLRQMGEPEQSADRIKSFIGYSLYEMYPTFTQAPVDELYRHFQHKAAETVVRSTVALPEAGAVLERLRSRGYKLAIASTKIKRHIDGIVHKLAWSGLFSTWSGGDEVESVKPDPAILNLTLNRLQARSVDTLVVGDTVNDVLAARQVPMKVVAVNSPYGRREELLGSEPDYFTESLNGLFNILDR